MAKETKSTTACKVTNLKTRHRKEKIFINLGRLSVSVAVIFLLFLFGTIIYKGSSAFFRTQIAIKIDLRDFDNLDEVDHRAVIKNALRQNFITSPLLNSETQPEPTPTLSGSKPFMSKEPAKNFSTEQKNPEIAQLNSLYQLVSRASNLELKSYLKSHPELLGKESIFWLSSSSKIDMYFKNQSESNLSKSQLAWAQAIKKNQTFRIKFNWSFFRFADSREAEIAGIAAGMVGSIFLVLVFLSLSFPVAVMCAFYLEEFAPRNRLTSLIEVSINNLAAIPSVIYGLLGLVVYLQFMNLPRSSAIAGGMTLSLLVLPVIIIATRGSIRRIPRQIRDGAIALGASKMQVVLHHLLPLSLPGIMTGTILAVSRAIGETAPLLMIGMIAFVADVPSNVFEPSSALPVQIYLWSDLPEMGFSEKTCAAIMILLLFLIILNTAAATIRKKFEKKW